MGYGVWLHGEAVAAGMVLAALASRELGQICDADIARIKGLLEKAGLPVVAPKLGVERYLELMAGDKKVDSGRIRYILMRRLGESYVAELAAEVVACALEAGCA